MDNLVSDTAGMAQTMAPSTSPGTIANGRQFGPVPQNPTKAQEDTDTCRICRGEGTVDEPLFYPCKCSGSIKYVHQECLMEWLSHSQKKHCELCKTSFRFTKLYHPQMPSSLPISVFARKAMLHIVKALVGWFRAVLVISVWGLWLPWSMRFVWWGLFWIGDGGWTKNLRQVKMIWDDREARAAVLGALTLNTTTSNSTPAAIPYILQAPMLTRIKAFFSGENWTRIAETAHNHSTASVVPSSIHFITDSSLLANVSFFHHLTPSPAVNRCIMDTVEGQIITLSVVTGFVLIFLIREWVVQQQPALNLVNPNGMVNEDLAANPPQAEPQPGVQAPVELYDEPRASAQNGESSVNEALTESWSNDHYPSMATSIGDLEDNYADLSSEVIVRLVEDLRSKQESLESLGRYLAHEDFAEWNGDSEELQRVKDLVARTRRAYFNLRRQAKASLISGDKSTAKSVLKLFQQLQEALQYLPWQDEAEKRDVLESVREYIAVAYHVLEDPPTEALEVASSDVQGASNAREYRPPMRRSSSINGEDGISTLAAAVSSGTAYASTSHEDASLRPTMPERDRSSLATEIQRDLHDTVVDRASSGSAELRSISERRRHGVSGEPAWTLIDLDNDLPNDEHGTEFAMAESSINKEQQTNIESVEHRHPLVEDNFMRPENQKHLDLPAASAIATSSNPTTTLNGAPHANDDGPSSVNANDLSSTEGSSEQNIDRDFPALQHTNVSEEAPLPADDRTMMERLMDWIYGDAQPIDLNHLHDAAVDEPPDEPAHGAAEAQGADGHDIQVPLNVEPPDHDPAADHNADALGQADANPNEVEAIEDAEDLEGIMELVGLHGPVIGLFQNAVFAAVLVSATIATAILFPYLCGKLVLLLLANPVGSVNVPLRLINGLTNSAIDVSLVVGGSFVWFLDRPVGTILRVLTTLAPAWAARYATWSIGRYSRTVADSAMLRLVHGFGHAGFRAETLFQQLDAHLSLQFLEARLRVQFAAVSTGVFKTWRYLVMLPYLPLGVVARDAMEGIFYLAKRTVEDLTQTRLLLLQLAGFSHSEPGSDADANYSIPVFLENPRDGWTVNDRIVAVLAGYTIFAIAGSLYINQASTFTTSEQGRRVENLVREIFHQSAGVVKVILIISLEMLMFPLYCGYLVDAAMLPLFEQSTVQSRLAFTISSPWTSIFSHWFVGTLFMWNFALFVAMCRKTFRKGVLYFIRDPDDPNFHPIRDVLEKSLSIQLKKIAFSALVYGLLIGFCMGSVVWTVAYATTGILPVRWSTQESYYGYPVDLLLYNFLAPTALHFLRPTKGFTKVYEWWFRRSARFLRLSHFLFDDFRDDERGETQSLRSDYGRFVRCPGTDTVRIPRGRRVFLEVNEANIRIDGQPEAESAHEIHGRLNEDFVKVWIPPRFQFRIAIFVILMWSMTAAMGLATTVAPLLLGRQVIRSLAPSGVTLNDVYAYFIGGLPLVALICSRAALATAWQYARDYVALDASGLASLSSLLKHTTLRGLRIIYTYGAFLFLMPTLLALLLECYFIIPLQTYATAPHRPAAPHTVYLLQDWTLGLMYVRILMRILLWDPESRVARRMQAIIARGWADPDAATATRCFILPLAVATALAVGLPFSASYLLASALPMLAKQAGVQERFPQLRPEGVEALRVGMVRFSYPLVLALALSAWCAWLLRRAAARWHMRIRDEIYLIGERLHNFGDRFSAVGSMSLPPSTARA